MNELINKISEVFKEDDRVIVYTYDKKIDIYAVVFTNIEMRKIWRIIQQEKIIIEISSAANNKVRITFEKEE